MTIDEDGSGDEGAVVTRVENAAPITAGVALRAALRLVAILALVFVAYAVIPGTEETTWSRALTFSLVLSALVILIVFEVRSVMKAVHPLLRAVQVLVTIFAIFIVVASTVYLGMSHSNREAFSQPLDHITALYFTVVVFSTVGFGDIYAKSDVARLVVTIQIFLDILFIAVVVRLVIGAVQRRRSDG